MTAGKVSFREKDLTEMHEMGIIKLPPKREGSFEVLQGRSRVAEEISHGSTCLLREKLKPFVRVHRKQLGDSRHVLLGAFCVACLGGNQGKVARYLDDSSVLSRRNEKTPRLPEALLCRREFIPLSLHDPEVVQDQGLKRRRAGARCQVRRRFKIFLGGFQLHAPELQVTRACPQGDFHLMMKPAALLFRGAGDC